MPTALQTFERLAPWMAGYLVAFGLTACTVSPGSQQGGASAIATGAISAPADQNATDTTSARPTQVPVKVVLLLPLSGAGTTAPIAKGLKQAAELAVIEQGNSAIQLIVKDDGGTPEGARAAAEQAIAEGAELIVGPLFAKSVEAVSPLARQAGVPVIAFSNDRRVAGNGTYLLSFLAEPEVGRIATYAMAQGKRRFAALVPDDAYGKLTAAALRAVVTRGGGSVAVIETFSVQDYAGANATLEPVRRLAEAIREAESAGEAIDALFIPASPETLASLAPQLAYARIDPARVKLLGTGSWDTPNLGRDAALAGGWYPAPDPRGWREFSERFARTFGSPAPRIASLAYDAMTMAITLAAGAPKARFTPATLTRPTGFAGIDGLVRLSADGASDRSLAILEVQKFGTQVLDPAPAAFAGDRLSSAAARVN